MFGKIKLHIVLTIGAILALAVLAACGGSATEPPAATPTAAPQAAAAPTAAPQPTAEPAATSASQTSASPHVGGFEQRAYCHALRLCGTVATAH